MHDSGSRACVFALDIFLVPGVRRRLENDSFSGQLTDPNLLGYNIDPDRIVVSNYKDTVVSMLPP